MGYLNRFFQKSKEECSMVKEISKGVYWVEKVWVI